VLATRLFAPEVAAASLRLRWLARALADAGAVVQVVTTRPPTGSGPIEDDPRWRVSRWPALRDEAGNLSGFSKVTRDMTERRRVHIALEYEFMGFLLAKERLATEGSGPCGGEQAKICRAAQHAFVTEHLAWWVPSYATGLRRKAGDGPYAALARILAAFMPVERSAHGIKAPQLPVRPMTIERPEEAEGCVGCSTGA
jgi:hypothetical protein